MKVSPLEYDSLGSDVTDGFAENGVVCLRGLIGLQSVKSLQDWIEVAIETSIHKPDRTYAVETHLWPRLKGFQDFAFNSDIGEAAAVVMGSRQARMYNDTLFVKEPCAPEPTPWHQDLPYFRLGGPSNCSAWIALDPANAASGAMCYALGSHRWGRMFQPTGFTSGENCSSEAYDGTPPDIDADPARYPTVSFDLKPGDVVFHHLLTLHKAAPNSSSGSRRRVHTIRFAGEGSRWVDRPFSTVEFQNALHDGDLLDGPEFPVLWPR